MLTWSETYLSIIDLVVSHLFVLGAYINLTLHLPLTLDAPLDARCVYTLRWSNCILKLVFLINNSRVQYRYLDKEHLHRIPVETWDPRRGLLRVVAPRMLRSRVLFPLPQVTVQSDHSTHGFHTPCTCVRGGAWELPTVLYKFLVKHIITYKVFKQMYKMWILDFIMHDVYVLTYISIDHIKDK